MLAGLNPREQALFFYRSRPLYLPPTELCR